MGICEFLSSNLASIGLVIDVFGAMVMVGSDIPYFSKVMFRLRPVFKQRQNAAKQLRKNWELTADDDDFQVLRRRLYPDDFLDDVIPDSVNWQADRFELANGVVKLHVERDDDHPDTFRQDYSDMDASLVRDVDRTFTWVGVGLLAFGFFLQIVAQNPGTFPNLCSYL